jgi:hypothetical protein
MPNQFSAFGHIGVDSYPDLLNKAIDTVWVQANQEVLKLAPFFDVETKDSGMTHVISSVTSQLPLPVENNDTEALPYFTPAPGFDKTFVLLPYRSGIRVTSTMLKADRFDKVMQMTTGQLKSARRLDEKLRAAIFNNSFASGTGSDAQYLCADSHPHENPDAGTWDNKGTGALTGANLQALRLLMRKMTDCQNDPEPVTPVTLLIPEDLEQAALELIRSPQRAEDALNAVTVLLSGLKVVVSEELSSAVAYWLIGDKQGYERGLCEVVLEDWNIKDNSPANADIVVDKRIKAIKAFGFTTSKNVFGSTGS